jgi:hypothetical protein
MKCEKGCIVIAINCVTCQMVRDETRNFEVSGNGLKQSALKNNVF